MKDFERVITEHLEEMLNDKQLHLYSVCYYQEAGNNILEVLLDDSQQTIDIKKIVEITPEVSNVLDRLDLIDEAYILDLSSCGLTIPLYWPQHYQRVVNQKIEILLNQREVSGNLLQVNQDGIVLLVNKEKKEIKFKDIIKARYYKGGK